MRNLLVLMAFFLVAFFVIPEIDESNTAQARNMVFAVPGGGRVVVVDNRGLLRRTFSPFRFNSLNNNRFRFNSLNNNQFRFSSLNRFSPFNRFSSFNRFNRFSSFNRFNQFNNNRFAFNQVAFNPFNRGRVNFNAFAVPSSFGASRAFFNPVNPIAFASPSPASFGVFGNPFVGNQAALLNGGFNNFGFNNFAFANRSRGFNVNNLRFSSRCR